MPSLRKNSRSSANGNRVYLDDEQTGPDTQSKMASPELVWSKATYNMESLMAKFSNKFPIIVRVNRGYYGKHDAETLASSQVARLHTWGMQERVMAKINKGRQISIPLDYPISFEVLDNKNSNKSKKSKKVKEWKLKDIIKECSLPVVVRFHKKEKWNFRIGEEKYHTKDFGDIGIMKVYTQRFLKGNTIHNGVIDTKVMLVPMYVNVTFKVATAIKGQQSDKDWQDIQTMYTNAVAHINFDAIKGTKDMTDYPADQLDPVDRRDLTDDELDDDVDAKDANANFASVTDRETTAVLHTVDTSSSSGFGMRNNSVDVGRFSNGDVKSSSNNNNILSMPVRQNLLMQVPKQDLLGNKRHSLPSGHHDDHGLPSMQRSEFSDYSSLGIDRSRQNIVHVNLGGDAQVITHEMYDQDFGNSGLIMRAQSRPQSAVGGSTIINLTGDDAEILSNGPSSIPYYYRGNTSRSESNLRRTFSDLDFQDNSVFLSNSQYNLESEVPSYVTNRRTNGRYFKQSYPSYSSVDVSRIPARYGRGRKFGQVILGGAPAVGDERRYHSMSNLSHIDVTDGGTSRPVSRGTSFRSHVTMSPSPGPGQRRHQPNLYLKLRDDAPRDTYIKRIEFKEADVPVTYTRRAGVDRATQIAATQIAATQMRPSSSTSHQRPINGQGVYFTDGYQNYPVRNGRRREQPTFADATDFVEVIEEDFTHSDPPLMQSPVMSQSSNEDKRYFIMYDNGSNEVPVVTEAMENGDEFVYQGSMTLRKARDFEQLSVGDDGSMIDIPIEDTRSPRHRNYYSSGSNHFDDVTSQHMTQAYTSRSTHHEHPINRGQRVESSSQVQQSAVYDEVDADESFDETLQHADMTKGAAEHWGRVMDLSMSSTSRHRVPVEVEGKSSRGIAESMFEGSHHSHSFTGRDRNVCRRLEQHRQDRSNSHRELSLRRDRVIHQPIRRTATENYKTAASSSSAGAAVGMNVRGPGVSTTDNPYEFRSNRNEVWSGEMQQFAAAAAPVTASTEQFIRSEKRHQQYGVAPLTRSEQQYGVAPLTTSEQEANALLRKAERVESMEHVAKKVEDHVFEAASQAKMMQVEIETEETSAAGSSGGARVMQQQISKGSTSSMSAGSSMSSVSGGAGQSYDLTGLDDSTEAVIHQRQVEVEAEIPVMNSNDSAGPAASAAAAAMADGNLDIQGDQRISRKTARELTRSGSVRSLREVYARSRSPSGSRRDSNTRMTIVPANEIFSDILNKPTEATNSEQHIETTTFSSTKVTDSSDGNVKMRTKATSGRIPYKPPNGAMDQDLAWQETQSYHLESIRDSIRDLDEYLKNQAGDTDSHSISSAGSSKHLEHFSYALTDTATY